MSTVQQLGLIGNSVKVQSLPTASAETFGAGNRFYTLIGQQEGYIAGHTYRTVVANDVYSWEDVAGGNYNMLDNIPVINQDLSASDFTPTANTYYRHTGTTDTYTQGVIYYYGGTEYKALDGSGGGGTEYKALDGSGGGGTTLNKYTALITLTSSTAGLLYRIFTEAKGRVISRWRISNVESSYVDLDHSGATNVGFYNTTFRLHENRVENGYEFSYRTDTNKGLTSQYNPINRKIDIIYYNDTEIT